MCLLQNDDTVLHVASEHGQHELLEHFLRTGIAVDVRNGDVRWHIQCNSCSDLITVIVVYVHVHVIESVLSL